MANWQRFWQPLRRLRPFAFPAALLGALELYARTAGRHSDTLAPTSAALQALSGAAWDGSLWAATGFTLGAAGLGLTLAMAIGIPLGVLLGLSRRAASLGFLSIEVLRPIPSVALIPLAMMIYGFGAAMEVFVIAFACTWPMLILSQAAVHQVDKQLLEVSAALELGAWARAQKIILPSVLPRLFVALRLCVAVALVVAVTVEIAANPHGMGYALMLAQQSLAPELMLAWLFWIGALGYAINALSLGLEQRVMGRLR